MLIFQYISSELSSGNQTWLAGKWVPFSAGILHCHVWLPEGTGDWETMGIFMGYDGNNGIKSETWKVAVREDIGKRWNIHGYSQDRYRTMKWKNWIWLGQ